MTNHNHTLKVLEENVPSKKYCDIKNSSDCVLRGEEGLQEDESVLLHGVCHGPFGHSYRQHGANQFQQLPCSGP